MKLTDRQRAALRTAHRHTSPNTYPMTSRKEVVAQLVAKGLAHDQGSWTRYEWNRKAGTFRRFSLTPEGKALCAKLFAQKDDAAPAPAASVGAPVTVTMPAPLADAVLSVLADPAVADDCAAAVAQVRRDAVALLTPDPASDTVTIGVTVSWSTIQDLLTTAFDGGYCTWARIEEYREPPRIIRYSDAESARLVGRPVQVYRYVDFPTNPGGALVISVPTTDDESERERHTLDTDACLRGLSVMAQTYPKHFYDSQTEGRMDAVTGDVFLQCALLGEVVYS